MMEDAEEHRDSLMLTNEDPVVSKLLIRPARPEDAELLVHLGPRAGRLRKVGTSCSGDGRRHFDNTCSVLSMQRRRPIAEVAGEPAGFALWFATFSTFRGQPGLVSRGYFRQTATTADAGSAKRFWPR